MEFHKPELLVVVFEVGGPLAVEAALLTFCHAHLLGHRQNRIALVAALAGTSEVVYPDGASRADDAATADFAGFDRVVGEKLRRLETAKDIADTLAKSRNVTYLPSGGQNMLLNLGAGGA